MKPLPAALAACILLAPAAAAEPIGRLFFTPEQRAQLDAERRAYDPRRGPPPTLGGAEAPPPVDTPPPVVIEVPPTRVTVNGLIRSSDGRAMVWLNNQMQELPPGASGGPARVRVGGPDGSGAVDVKVGQSYLSSPGDPQAPLPAVRQEPAR